MKYGLTALMMAFAMTLCYSCSSDDDDEPHKEVDPPANGDGKTNGHEYVEIAGIKWATENVGAVSEVTPSVTNENYGYYYTQSKAIEAAESWGREGIYKWTLPTKAQWQALIESCYWVWLEDYRGMNGWFAIDKKHSSQCIFLPAAGMNYEYFLGVSYLGSRGYYWSSDYGKDIELNSSYDTPCIDQFHPNSGLSVRPVLMKDLTPTTGTAEATIKNVKTDVKWVQLWKNGPKFAEHNVGATSATECGGYYCWGGTYQNGVGIEWNEKCKTDWGDLTREEDTATTLWGNNWRMPTMAELSHAAGGLLHECDCKWVTNYNNTGVNGLLCTGKGDYDENSMFLPAAGRLDYGTLWGKGDNGHYWSSSQYDGDNASPLFFNSYGQRDGDYATRSIGYSVRAVLNENK